MNILLIITISLKTFKLRGQLILKHRNINQINVLLVQKFTNPMAK